MNIALKDVSDGIDAPFVSSTIMADGPNISPPCCIIKGISVVDVVRRRQECLIDFFPEVQDIPDGRQIVGQEGDCEQAKMQHA